MDLGLSPARLAERRLGVGGSDAGKIMMGDWRQLWLEKTGRAEPEDLSDILAVQMGSFTENFNAFWYTKQTGRLITERSTRIVSVRHPFMCANLDGVTTTSKGAEAYWDAKHVGRLDEATALRYTPQMVHCCTILDLDWWVLSVFVGNSKYEVLEQECDPIYQATLIAREREFWGFVERDEEPPEAGAPVLAPKPQPKLRTLHIPTDAPEAFDAMARQFNWLSEFCRNARKFVDTQPAATVNALARAANKDLVPEDFGEVVYGAYRFARTKAGAVTQAARKGDDDAP